MILSFLSVKLFLLIICALNVKRQTLWFQVTVEPGQEKLKQLDFIRNGKPKFE